GERAARGLELAQIPEQSGARAHEHGLAQNEQLTRARLVETNADREEGLERSGEPLSALARAPSERRDATARFGEQREHEIGLAELDEAEHERRALVNRRRSRCGHPIALSVPGEIRDAGARESSCGMSSPRGLSTMLSASVNRMSRSTKAIATPKRRPRAGFGALFDKGSGVTVTTRRLAV